MQDRLEVKSGEVAKIWAIGQWRVNVFARLSSELDISNTLGENGPTTHGEHTGPSPGLEEASLACSGAAGNHQGSHLASLRSRVSRNNSSLALRGFVATENSSENVSLIARLFPGRTGVLIVPVGDQNLQIGTS